MAKTLSTTLAVVSNEIRDKAYILAWTDMVFAKLVKRLPIGGGQGTSIHWPYFDPTTYATAASEATETNDFATTTALTNASITVTATEFAMRVDITDLHKETTTFNSVEQAHIALGTGLKDKLERSLLGTVIQSFNTGTVTATNSTNGVQFSDLAKAKAVLDSRKCSVPGRKQYVTSPLAWLYTAKSTWSQTYASSMGKPGDESLAKYYIQSLLGDVDAYYSPHLTSTSTLVHAMFSQKAAGLWIIRDFRVENQRDASARADEYIGSMVYGASILIQGYGVRLNGYGKV